MVIKYIGSKRTLVPVLGEMASAAQAVDATDLFTGTTRVAQEFKRRGIYTTAVDIATYSEVLAQCYIETNSESINREELVDALVRLNSVPGYRGYFTRTFCEASRYFQPKNGKRVDAIRDVIDTDYSESALYPVLLTALMLAADRVDSTTGVQMAFLKQWAPRAHNDLELRAPELLSGNGRAVRGDVANLIDALPNTDIMYLDPPYNQHRYFTNYHIWETLVRWDAPEAYGVAMKRIDSRDDSTKSIFNMKRQMPAAFADVIKRARANMLIVSYNDESWITATQMMDALSFAGYEDVRMVAFDSKRYVGAQIGIYNLKGHRVGEVSHLRNTEYIFVAGETARVDDVVAVATRASAKRTQTPALF